MWGDRDFVRHLASRPRPHLRPRPIDCPQKTDLLACQCHPVPLRVPPVRRALGGTAFPGEHKKTRSFAARHPGGA